jgi:type I restriction enzyme S subunit
VIGGLLLALPPIEEQAAILTYLDRETARLDELVARKRQHLGLLAERRQALITRAVIRGLDPGAPLADSAVEWIGEIPAHWETARAKYVARLESGHTPSRDNPEYWEDCTIPWVTLSDVWQLRSGTTEVIRETKEKISELGLANSAARLLPAGTVILSRTASVGFSGILAEPMATTQDFVNWIPGDRISSEFLLQCFRAMRPEFDRLMMGSTHKTIYMPDVVKFVIPLPPPEEQAAIVQHIRDETARLDALVAKVKESIQRLREYRAALITAAVTGKIDVTV